MWRRCRCSCDRLCRWRSPWFIKVGAPLLTSALARLMRHNAVLHLMIILGLWQHVGKLNRIWDGIKREDFPMWENFGLSSCQEIGTLLLFPDEICYGFGIDVWKGEIECGKDWVITKPVTDSLVPCPDVGSGLCRRQASNSRQILDYLDDKVQKPRLLSDLGGLCKFHPPKFCLLGGAGLGRFWAKAASK